MCHRCHFLFLAIFQYFKDNNCYRYLRILLEIILFYNNWNILLKDIQLSTSQDPYKTYTSMHGESLRMKIKKNVMKIEKGAK